MTLSFHFHTRLYVKNDLLLIFRARVVSMHSKICPPHTFSTRLVLVLLLPMTEKLRHLRTSTAHHLPKCFPSPIGEQQNHTAVDKAHGRNIINTSGFTCRYSSRHNRIHYPSLICRCTISQYFMHQY